MIKYEKTYCNPTPLPDYPIGRFCYRDRDDFERLEDFRESADPSVIYDNGVWYMYPSCGMVYWSEDFIHWNHKHMEPYDAGYAPTVVKYRGKYLLCACNSGLYESDSPLGPFKSIGPFVSPSGDELKLGDPMLFADDDGRLYLYSGCGGEIRGAELDGDNPTHLITENLLMYAMDTDNHEWERIGDWNEDPHYSWVEGSWMYKRGDTYYLTYSAPGTHCTSYGMGAYKGKSPLGPWEYMSTSPFLLTKHGLVRGTGHGSIVDGPNGTTWVFYTCLLCYAHRFERRIGYDLISFDENGDIIPRAASETPQWAPGVIDIPDYNSISTDLIPASQRSTCFATSYAPGRAPIYANDDATSTWWQPAPDDEAPMFTVRVSDFGALDICAVRIWWRDVGFNIKDEVFPGPFGYRVESKLKDGEWETIIDNSDNDVDMNIDYIPFEVRSATFVRLVITKKPEGIEPGVINFTVFCKKKGKTSE